MSLKIHSVVNSNLASGEHVWLKPSTAVNLTGYAVVDRTFDVNGKVSNEFRHIFIFPNLAIAKEDWVRLYTGNGSYSKTKIIDGEGYIHNFYWGSGECVWNNNGADVASLIKYSVINQVIVPSPK